MSRLGFFRMHARPSSLPGFWIRQLPPSGRVVSVVMRIGMGSRFSARSVVCLTSHSPILVIMGHTPIWWTAPATRLRGLNPPHAGRDLLEGAPFRPVTARKCRPTLGQQGIDYCVPKLRDLVRVLPSIVQGRQSGCLGRVDRCRHKSGAAHQFAGSVVRLQPVITVIRQPEVPGKPIVESLVVAWPGPRSWLR